MGTKAVVLLPRKNKNTFLSATKKSLGFLYSGALLRDRFHFELTTAFSTNIFHFIRPATPNYICVETALSYPLSFVVFPEAKRRNNMTVRAEPSALEYE